MGCRRMSIARADVGRRGVERDRPAEGRQPRRYRCGRRSSSANRGNHFRRRPTITTPGRRRRRGVANPNLELTLYGTSGKEIQLVAGRGQSDVVPHNLWTGTTTSPSAAALRDRNNFVDLSAPLAKIRWVIRTSGFHQAWPIVKLADGTWLVGDRPSGLQADFNESEITPADLRWLKLDIARVVTVGTWIDHPDLTKVDAVGFADLLPGSGHGAGGYINVGRIEVYGNRVKR